MSSGIIVMAIVCLTVGYFAGFLAGKEVGRGSE
jgi:hypothetical protein